MMNKCYLMSVDFQNDFADKCGKYPCCGDSVRFIKEELFSWIKNNKLIILEIISDYRLPRGNSKNESCVPGTYGYKSLIPKALKQSDVFIKCMHSPIWNRHNIGETNIIPSDVYPDPDRFSKWVEKHMPDKSIPVVLFGETLECCILNVAQELYFRGYKNYIIYEGTDPMPVRQCFKDTIAFHSSISLYAEVLKFNEIKKIIGLV